MDFNAIAEASRASIEKDDLKILLPIIASINPQNIFSNHNQITVKHNYVVLAANGG